jgi:hypothetical protein
MPKKSSIGKLPATIDGKPSPFIKYGPQLDEMRIFYEADVVLALYDALVLARDSGLPAPDWVIEGAVPIVGAKLKDGIPTGQGASGNTAARYKTDMKHFHRWLVVRKLHENGAAGSLYKKAEKLLKGQFGWGSAAVIGKSFRRVERHLKDPKTALRYYRGLQEGQKLMRTKFPGPYKPKASALGQK